MGCASLWSGCPDVRSHGNVMFFIHGSDETVVHIMHASLSKAIESVSHVESSLPLCLFPISCRCD